jgi:Ion channel
VLSIRCRHVFRLLTHLWRVGVWIATSVSAVGFGDIYPVALWAQMIVALQVLITVVYTTVIFAQVRLCDMRVRTVVCVN